MQTGEQNFFGKISAADPASSVYRIEIFWLTFKFFSCIFPEMCYIPCMLYWHNG